MNHSKIRWGILGCGRIAKKFASDLRLVNDAELIAVASRSKENAVIFAREFPCKYVLGSYEELAMNSEVDVIYIATPHSCHYENTLLCLKHNKAVLCEKAFAINCRQAKEMIAKAREKKVFLMEALWTKFLPHYIKLLDLVENKTLGDIKAVLINFGFRLGENAPVRLMEPALGGGTLLDIGIYNVFMALSVLGKPDSIEAAMVSSPQNIDEQLSVLFKYNSGSMAQLFSSFTTNLPTQAEICGTKGGITITTRFYEPSARLELYQDVKGEKKVISVIQEEGYGYQYEARHVNDCLKKGLTESPLMTHSDTLLLMETMDEIRRIAGIKYAED